MSDLADVLAGVIDPRLDGAACAGKAPLFDPREPDESLDAWKTRIDQAALICRRCPIANACAEVAASIPKTRRAGIWSGRNQGGNRCD